MKRSLLSRIGLGWVVTACAAVAVIVFLLTRLTGGERPALIAPASSLDAVAGLDPASGRADVEDVRSLEEASPTGDAEDRNPAAAPVAAAPPAPSVDEDVPTQGGGLDLTDAAGDLDAPTELAEASAAGSDDPTLEELIPEDEALAALDALAPTSAQAEESDPRSTRTRRPARKAPLKTGMLALSVSGWADVTVDGKPVCRFPQVRRFQLPEGAHVLELHNPHRQPYRARVTVRAGQEVAHLA